MLLNVHGPSANGWEFSSASFYADATAWTSLEYNGLLPWGRFQNPPSLGKSHNRTGKSTN